jgi:REP element-mobilizing transposase RayT
MGRGIEKTAIFRKDGDRIDFLNRIALLCQGKAWKMYAFALMDNHVHLLVRTDRQSLSYSMKKLLTGYVVNFNRRHKRYGHLFQNRYKSIICEDDPYLLELTRYIHLNPLRAGVVRGLEELSRYPWTGHAALMGKVKREWQDVDTVLGYFGSRRHMAIKRYEQFVRDGVSRGRRPELVGGGLIRSLGGWSQVVSFRRKGMQSAHDDRILGSSDFVSGLLREAEGKEKETLRLSSKRSSLDSMAREIIKREGVEERALRGGSSSAKTVRARRLFCQLAVKKMNYYGAEVARYLGMTTSSVNRNANAEELSEIKDYLKII